MASSEPGARCLVLALALACFAPAPAQAQLTVPEERADALYREARELFNARRFEEAGALFLRAWDVYPDSRYLYNGARSHEVAGDLVTAADLYHRYLALSPPPDDVAQVAEHVRGLEDVLRATHGRVRVTSSPTGAFVFFTGEAAERPATSPVRRWLKAGPQVVTVELDGHASAERRLVVEAGRDEELAIQLTPLTRVGGLSVSADVEGAHVYLDNRYVGLTPLTLEGVAVGEHTVRVESEGRAPFVRQTPIRQGEVADVFAALSGRASPTSPTSPAVSGVRTEASEGGSSVAGWAVLGSGLAVAVAGGVLHGLAFGEASAADALIPEDPDYDSDFAAHRQRGEGMQIGAWLGYGLGAVGVGVGIWLLATTGDDDPTPADDVSWRLTPTLAADSAGALLQARF